MIVGQIGLLFYNISWAAPVATNSARTTSTQSAKQLGNQSGFEYLNNTQRLATSLDYDAGSGNLTISPNAKVANDSKISGERINDINNMTITKQDGSQVRLNVHDLTPDSANPQNSKKYYNSGKNPDVNSMQAISLLPETVVEQQATGQHNVLEAENEQEGGATTVEGHVYGIMADIGARKKPDLSTDPAFSKAKKVMATTRANGNIFTDCTKQEQFFGEISKKSVHTEQLEYCVQADYSKGCYLSKKADFGLYNFGNTYFPTVMSSTDSDSKSTYKTSFFLGDKKLEGVSQETLKGDPKVGCQSSPQIKTVAFEVEHKSAIKRVYIDSMIYSAALKIEIAGGYRDGHTQTVVNHNSNGYTVGSRFDKDGNYIEGTADMSLPMACGNTSRYIVDNNDVDITKYILSDNTSTINIKVSYYGVTPSIKITTEYDPREAISNDEWTGDADCLAQAEAINNGAIKGKATCTENLTADTNGLVNIGGLFVKESDLTSSLGLPGICAKAKIEVTDDDVLALTEGKKDCATLLDTSVNKCGFAGEKCLKEFVGDDFKKHCIVTQRTYDCGYDTEIDTPVSETVTSCPGPIACMGNECVSLKINESSAQDFAKAMGVLTEAQSTITDMSCEKTSDGGLSCRIFPGEWKSCNKFRGNSYGIDFGKNECCEEDANHANPEQIVKAIVQKTSTLALNNKYTNMARVELLHVPFKGFQVNDGKGDIWGNITNVDHIDMDSTFEKESNIAGFAWSALKSYTGVGQEISKVEGKIAHVLAKPLTIFTDNMSPYIGVVAEGVITAVMDKIIADVVTMVFNIIVDAVMAVGHAIAGALTGGAAAAASQAATQAASQAGQQAAVNGAATGAAGGVAAGLATCVTIIGIVYAIYSIAKLIATLLMACPEDQYEIASKLNQKTCEYTSTYRCVKKKPLLVSGCFKYQREVCCFSSPLSRIMNKQIKCASSGHHCIFPTGIHPMIKFFDIMGVTYSYNHGLFNSPLPDCSGVTIEQMESADWSLVDMSEWLQMLKATNRLSADHVSLNELKENFMPSGAYNDSGTLNKGQTQKDQSW